LASVGSAGSSSGENKPVPRLSELDSAYTSGKSETAMNSSDAAQ
jgi:hypothetical protein